MKRLYLILYALLAMVGIANATEGGDVVEKTLYDVPFGNFDIDYHTTEVIPEGKTVVVFYYTHKDLNFATRDFAFGANYKEFAYSNEKDADGNLVVRFYDKDTPIVKSNQSLLINLYSPLEDDAQWAYVICDVADKKTVADPFASQGGGGDTKPEPTIIAKGANVKPNTLYALPFQGQEGYVSDNTVTLETAATADQYVVAFLNAPFVTSKAIDFKKIFYNGAGNREYTPGAAIEDGGEFSFMRYYRQGPDSQLDVYAEDMNGYDAGYTWNYVIVNSLDEAKTVANPFAKKSDAPEVVPGQDITNAIVLTQDVAADFKSTNKNLYVKFVAPNSGTVTMTLSQENNYARWMEDGVMAYGQLKQNYFTNGNQFNVEKGKTYYCYYGFAADVEGTVSFSLEAAEEGTARGEAILIESDCSKNLLGVAPQEIGNEKIYTNKTTWFKLEKDGALADKTLMTVTLGGSNETEVALFKNDETVATKTYAMGSGSGMLPKNSTVNFDINLAENDYYIAITQDANNGTAKFAFTVAQPGETFGTAIEAQAGENTAAAGTKYYKYTHAGDAKWMKITGSVVKSLYNEDQKEILNSDDFSEGTEIAEGTTVYFQATGNFTIALTDIEAGRVPENPVIIDNENGAKFTLNGNSSDTRRYMQYAATEDGMFIYATSNAKVIDTASSATVRDVTNAESPKTISIVQKETDEFGESMFIYQWPVVADHTYLIEQNLGNNFGQVDFYTMFTAAEPGESLNKAIAINLYDAVDLGRKATTPKYYKFTAAEAGDYTVSVQMKGSVKSYDAEGNGSSIGQSYSDGLVYHNGTFTLAAGESLVFSCEPSEDIEHINVAIQDQFIPNYYATVTKADQTGGLDYNQPETIAENDEMTLDANNVWYGPVAVPADKPLYVVADLNDETETSAIYFAVETETNGLQWINTKDAISVEIDGKQQIFTIAASAQERNIHILGYGLLAAGKFHYSFTEPQVGPAAENLTLVPTITFDADDNTLTIKATLPETFNESETAVENLNMWALSITNTTTSETIELTNGGDGTYNAGEKLTAINKVDNAAFFNTEDTYLVTFGCPTTSNVVISALPVSLSAPSTEISELVEDVTILNLKADKEYTLNANAVLGLDVVTINGNGATIKVGEAGKFSVQKGIVLDNVVLDGTATANSIVELSSNPDASLATYTMEGETATYKYEGASQKVYEAQGITIKNSTLITNNSVIRPGAAWALRNLSIDNSIIEVKYKSGKAIINMEENGANSVQNIAIKNSTIYADDAATDMRFICYTNASNAQSQKVWGTDDNNASLTLENNTFVGVCGNKEFANNYVNNKLYQFTFKNNAFINTWRVNKLGANNTRNFELADNVISGGTNAVDGTDANWFTAVDDLGAVWNFGEGEGQTAVPVATDVEALGAAFGLYDDYKTFGDPRWADYSKGEAPTGITNVASQSAKNSAIYNLAGQRVDANAKGILIINGKKVLKK